jgi:hypothetical protein
MVHTPRGPDPGTVMRRFGMGPGDSFGAAKLRLGIQPQTDGCIFITDESCGCCPEWVGGVAESRLAWARTDV